MVQNIHRWRLPSSFSCTFNALLLVYAGDLLVHYTMHNLKYDTCSHLLNPNVTTVDLVSVEVLSSQGQTALGDYRILLCPKVTGSKGEERRTKV